MKMYHAFLLAAMSAATFAAVSQTDNTTPHQLKKTEPVLKAPAAKIQAAILLDVSNSMDGLISQAKSQLWNMVSVMGRASCDGVAPQIEIALYEYGRTTNEASRGYVKQISGFTSNLDELSAKLFALNTQGGDEYCSQVIYTSASELPWDVSDKSYKVIFIAGNEDFRQGTYTYTQACTAASAKNIIVNTIYCGPNEQGVREHWNMGAECGKGSYTNINQDAKRIEIPTPYDDDIMVLNEQLNGTYISYGTMGRQAAERQVEMDKANYMASKSAGLERAAVKSTGTIYSNAQWDVVDASKADSAFYKKVDTKTLPDALQKLSKPALKIEIARMKASRDSVQKAIAELAVKRNTFIMLAKQQGDKTDAAPTLETAIEKMIREQAARYNMVIK